MRILVVDDHTLFRESLKYLLQDFKPSAVVIEASSAEDALRAVSVCPDLHLIILDLHLSGTNGLDVIPALREQAPAVPIVLLSAEQDPNIIRKALTAGAAGFVSKTAGSQEITRTLQQILAGKIR